MKKALLLTLLGMVVGSVLVLAGGLFRIQHWEGADGLLLGGLGVLCGAGAGFTWYLIRRYFVR